MGTKIIFHIDVTSAFLSWSAVKHLRLLNVTAARLASGEYRQYSLFDHAKCKKI